MSFDVDESELRRDDFPEVFQWLEYPENLMPNVLDLFFSL
jgi:hypothetical protein